jgi:hypothetical protein
MENLKNRAQFGASFSSDFRKDTWTFKMDKGYKVMAGEFAILPKKQYAQYIQTFELLSGVLLSLSEHPNYVNGENQEFICQVDFLGEILSKVERQD